MADLFRYRKLIEAINEEQSFSRAAQKLFMPQPSLSVIIKKREEEIGMPLFDRTTKPIRLTDAGREYLRTAQEIDLSDPVLVEALTAGSITAEEIAAIREEIERGGAEA